MPGHTTSFALCSRHALRTAALAVGALALAAGPALAQEEAPSTAPSSAPTTQPGMGGMMGPHHGMMGQGMTEEQRQYHQSMMQFHGISAAVAQLHPTEGSDVHGTVHFTKTPEGVKVTADVEGLAPNTKHGFHIHEYGDCTDPAGKSAGGHYNPAGVEHGLPGTTPRHAGDLGNLEADANGMAHYEATFDTITVSGMGNPIIGRGVIVHAKEDTGEQPTGGAGARLACGTIGVAKGE